MPGLNKEERTKDGCQYAASSLVSTKKNNYLLQLRNIPGIASPVKKNRKDPKELSGNTNVLK
jgi:hypothetical protein